MRSVHTHSTTLLYPEFDAFYRRYAPSLWGFIVRAQLPASQSETILINTLLKAWQQRQQTKLIDPHLFTHILRLAYEEGLPVNPSIWSAIQPIDHSYDRDAQITQLLLSSQSMETIIAKSTQSWWLLYLHDTSYVLMGVVLLVHPGRATILHPALLGGLLLLAGLSTGLVGLGRSQRGQPDTQWYVLSALRDGLFGLALLVQMGSPPETITSSLGLWALIYAFLQAIEAMFYFLGTRSSGKRDYWVVVIHFVGVLVAGALGFGLVMVSDEQPTSLGFVGLFLIGLGLLRGLLTWRLAHPLTR